MRTFILLLIGILISICSAPVFAGSDLLYDELDRINRVSLSTEVTKNKPDNNSFEYAKSSIRCSAINSVRFIRKQNTEAKYEADLTTTSGENLTMTVGYTYGNASSKEPGWRTISVKEGGIITDIRKQGQWLPNGYK